MLSRENNSVSLIFPADYDNNQSYPLTLALHWGLENYPGIENDFLEDFVAPAFDGVGVILAAPRRIGVDWTNAANEVALLAWINRLRSKYPINSRQILLTGYSMGGIGSWLIGGRHQELFAGIMPISAQPPPEVVDMDWKIPLFVIHSRRDEFFPFVNVERVVRALQHKGTEINWQPVDRGTHFDPAGFVPYVGAGYSWIRETWV